MERTVPPARARALRRGGRIGVWVLVALVLLVAVTTLVDAAGARVPGWLRASEPAAYVLAAVLALARPIAVRAQRTAWTLIGAAVAVRTAAMLVYLDVIPTTVDGIGGILWTIAAVLLLAGAIALATSRLPRPSVVGAVDLLTAGAALAALVATALVGVLSGRSGADTLAGTVLLLAFPALDIALIVVSAAFLVAWRWRPPLGIALVVGGGVGVAGADLVVVARTVQGAADPLAGLSLLALASLAAIAAAAALDDDRAIPAVDPSPRGDVRRTAVVAIGSLMLLVAAAVVDADSVVVIGLGAVTLGLVARTAIAAHADRTYGAIDRAMAQAGVGDWQVDTAGRHTWSPTMYAILGVSPSVPATQGLYESLVHPEDRELRRTSWAEATRTGTLDARYRIQRPDGEVRLIELQATNPGTVDGRPLVWTGTLQDVTERAAFEEALRRSERTLHDVLSLTNDGWFSEDLRTGACFHSARWWELHGYAPGELDESPDVWRMLTHPDDIPISYQVFDAAVADRSPVWTLRLRALHRDGHAFPILVRGSIHYDDDGTPTTISGVATDLSAVEASDRAKAAFLSAISHELRTPLTSIGGALETLRGGRAGEVPDGMVQLLELAERNTGRLRALVDDLLDLGRLRAGQAVVRPARVSLATLLDQAVEDHQRSADGAGIRLVRGDVPSGVVLELDPLRVAQVLGNLLSNAVRYAPVDTEVQLTAERVGADRVAIEVTDNGPGIPAAFTSSIFEPFTQADTDDARSHGGTGLGLAISHEIVTQLGGTIDLVSAPGRTTFRVDLPLRRTTSDLPGPAGT